MNDSEPLAVSVDKARRLTDPPIGRDRMYALIGSGQIRCLRLGKRILIPPDEVRRFVERELKTAP